MDIITAFTYRKCGYRIRRTGWIGSLYYVDPKTMRHTKLSTEDVLANDWIVITEGIVSDFPIKYKDQK